MEYGEIDDAELARQAMRALLILVIEGVLPENRLEGSIVLSNCGNMYVRLEVNLSRDDVVRIGSRVACSSWIDGFLKRMAIKRHGMEKT